MELRHIRYFIAVAEELHFRRAAERLHISQPPLSIQIADLERELGTRLFDRTSQRVSLTPAGRVFLGYARQMFDLVADARREVLRAGDGEAGELRVAFTQSSEFLDFLPEAVRRHQRDYPHVTFSLQQMRTGDQISAIVDGALDIGVTRKPTGAIPRTVELVHLHDDPLVLAVHADHPIAQRDAISIRETRALKFIAYPAGSSSGLRELTLNLCRQARFSPHIVQEAREVPTMLGLVSAQVGVALVPASSRHIGGKAVRFLKIVEPEAQTALFMTRMRSGRSKIVESFGSILSQVAAEYGVDR